MTTTKLVKASTLEDGDEIFVNGRFSIVDCVVKGPVTWTYVNGVTVTKVPAGWLGIFCNDERTIIPVRPTTLIHRSTFCEFCGRREPSDCRCSR